MRLVAKHTYPTARTLREREEAMAADLKITWRSCNAYMLEERRMPEDVEERFIELYGEPTEDGWREVVLRNREDDSPPTKPRMKRGRNAEVTQAYRDNWRAGLIEAARALADGALGHRLGDFTQNTVTYGEVEQFEKDLDAEEAMHSYRTKESGKGFNDLAARNDYVTTCLRCELVGAIDDSAQEINGLVFKVTCGTRSYRFG